MSYMNSTAALVPAISIQELSLDEVNEVGGGPAWLLPVLAAVALTALASEIAHHH